MPEKTNDREANRRRMTAEKNDTDGLEALTEALAEATG